MGLRFFNTLTKRKEAFEPLTAGKATMYNCGPTVYSYAHIGNFRSFMLADLLRRYLEYKGLDVAQVMNITDVGHLTDDADEGEDKLEVSARKEKKDPWQIAAFYSEAFFEDANTLRLMPATHYPRATDHVKEMIDLVEVLLQKGYAYEVNGCVYFALETFPEYGQLSGNRLEDLEAGARLEVNPDKRNPHDFALWVTDPEHLMNWESPWGVGYPGWHLECSVMSMKYLGETLDLHTGGEDNIFPHHEAEIAQSEAATGQPFVRCWLHARHLLVDNRKMSKSAGNFYTLRDLLEKGCSPVAIRYLLLSTHYRQPLNFTLGAIEAAGRTVQRLRDFRDRLQSQDAPQDHPEFSARLDQAGQGFEEALDDDLNISKGLGSIFDFVRETNRLSLSQADAAKALGQLKRWNTILQVLDDEEAPLDEEIERLIEAREQARKAKDFARSDQIRDQLKARGILLEDGPDGVRWKRTV